MKKIKKKLPMLATAAAICFVSIMAGGCSGNRGSERLYIYNWTYYTPDSVVEQFEDEFGVTVIYDEYSSNEEMFAKLMAGGLGYDIVFPSEDYVEIMIRLGMLERIDKDKLPNIANIEPSLRVKIDHFDPGMNYSVPYFWGAAGIIVNTARVPDYEENYSIFSRTDLRGRMTMLDDMREVLGVALIHQGFSANTHNPNEVAMARDLINNMWKPNLVKFDAEAFGKGYAQGDFWVVHGYAEVVFEEIEGNEELIRNTVFFIPPGSPAYVDSMVILRGARNIDMAHEFINFIHRPEIYAEFTDLFDFPATANSRAAAFKENDDPPYTMEDLRDSELKYDLGEALEIYNNAWESIKMGF